MNFLNDAQNPKPFLRLLLEQTDMRLLFQTILKVSNYSFSIHIFVANQQQS